MEGIDVNGNANANANEGVTVTQLSQLILKLLPKVERRYGIKIPMELSLFIT